MSSKLNIRELCDLADKEIKRDKYDIELPASIIEFFARFLVPEIRKYLTGSTIKVGVRNKKADKASPIR